MLARTAKVLGVDTSDNDGIVFVDHSSIASWATEAVDFVSTFEDSSNQMKIMGGMGNNIFSPTTHYTKQQAFITMKRLFNAL